MKNAARLFALCVLGLLCACGPEEKLPTVDLFVTSDIEGVFWSRQEPRHNQEVVGGLSVLKKFLDKQNTPFLLLEGGNWFGQTPEGTLSQGDYFNTVAASLPYAARMFTEPDLWYGWGSLSQIIKNSPAPFVLSNVTVHGQTPAGARPWLIKEVGGVKIGILSIISPRVLQDKQRVGALEISPEVETAQNTIQLLRQEGAQAILLLSALGAPEDETALTDVDLAEEVADADVIIAADLSREDAEYARVGKTLIVYPGSRLDSVGRVQLVFSADGEVTGSSFEDIALQRKDFGEDETIAVQVAALRRAAQTQMNRPLGRTEKAMKGSLSGESKLGDWAADCLRKWAKADAAVINASSLRADLPAGQVTQYDLYKIYPYTDNVTYLTMKGDALLRALEAGLAVPDDFAQISGLKVRYSPGEPAGKKIISASINGKPLSPSGTYRVAVTDHMLAGGAGHDEFIDSLEFKNTQVKAYTVLRLCLTGKKAVSVPEGGRWSMVK